MTSRRHSYGGAVLAVGSLMLAWACDTIADTDLALDQLTNPDTNTAVVVLSRDVPSARVTLERGVEYVYTVRGDRSPHTLLAERIVQGDTTRITFVISDLYAAGIVETDGTLNRVSWTDPNGIQYTPAARCLLDVTQAYVFGTPSVLRVQTACDVQGPGVDRLTVYTKAARFERLGG